jgi:hypothetical protein
MPAAALKRKPRPVEPASPAIPDARLGLHDAIERRKQADATVQAQHASIYRSQGLVIEAEKQIEKLRAKVSDADRSDEQRAASMIKVERPVVSAWSGENARTAVKRAEANLEMTIRARAKLQAELRELELAAMVALNDVLTERTKLVAPIAAATLARLRVLRTETVEALAFLNILVDIEKDAPKFHGNDIVASLNARQAREAALGDDVRAGAKCFPLHNDGSAKEFELQQAVTRYWSTKLSALLTDPLAEL